MFKFLQRRKPKTDISKATQALKEAEKTVEKVKSREEEVHEVVAALRDLRERNHFAEQLMPSMLGHNYWKGKK